MGIEGIGYMDGATAVPIPEVVTTAPVAVAASQEAVVAQAPRAQAPRDVQQDTYRSQQATEDPAQARQAPDDRHIESTLDKAISAVNKKMGGVSYMEYEYFKPTKNVVIKVLNQETKEVIREIPPKKHLEAIAKMWELAGIMVDEKK